MSRTRANLLLLLAALCWGCGNVCQKTVLTHLDPLSVVGLRCLIAALLIAPLMRLEPRPEVHPGCAASLARVAACFALAMVIQQMAYGATSVTHASFLVNTATVMTPAVAWWLLRERPTSRVVVAGALTLAGALLLSGGFAGGTARGDAAAILSAGVYAVWIVELSRHLRTHGRPFAAATAQFALTAAVLVPVILLCGSVSLPALRNAGPDLLVLGVFSTGVAFGLQSVAQRHTPPSHAAILISAESVFGATAAALLLGERVSLAGAGGAALILLAIALVALPRLTAGRPAGFPAGPLSVSPQRAVIPPSATAASSP